MKITGPQSLHAFRGTSKTDMVRRTFNTLDHFGKGSEISIDLAKRLFDHLVARGILMTELEEAQGQNRAPISYAYVSYSPLIICILLSAKTNTTPCQLGPKAKEFLANRPPFVLTIRSGKRAVGAPRSKKAPQYPVHSPMISTKRKRTRTQTPDDTIGTFSPIDDYPNFDDIETEPEPVSVSVLEPVPEHQPDEPILPPLLQARRLRVEPSIQAIECPTEDLNQECFRALCTLRDQVCWFLASASSRRSVHAFLAHRGTRLRPAGDPLRRNLGNPELNTPWRLVFRLCCFALHHVL